MEGFCCTKEAGSCLPPVVVVRLSCLQWAEAVEVT